MVARKAVEAQDVDPRLRHLLCWQHLLTLTDKPGQSGFVNGRTEAEDVLQMLAITFGGEAEVDGRHKGGHKAETTAATMRITTINPVSCSHRMRHGLFSPLSTSSLGPCSSRRRRAPARRSC